MSLETRIIALANAIGADVKTLTANAGSLSALTTVAKTSLVAAINELVTATASAGSLSALTTVAKTSLVAAINEVAAATASAGAQINDTAGNGDTLVTWSADKIYDSIEAAKTAVTNSLVNGAGAALDTLNELAAALNNDPSFSATIATQIANRVRYDAAQTLTTPQQAQACANIGIGDPERDLAAAYTTAKA